MTDRDFDDADDQDGAEVLDEANLTDDSEDIVNFDTMDTLLDVTQTEDDADEDDEGAAVDEADLDPDALDEDQVGDGELGDALGDYETDIGAAGEVEQGEPLIDRADPNSIEGLDQVEDADGVERGDEDISDYASRRLSDDDLEALGYVVRPSPPPSKAAQARLDEALEESFPASDPVSIMPGAD